MRRALAIPVIITVLAVTGCSGNSSDDNSTSPSSAASASASLATGDAYYAAALGTFDPIDKSGTGDATIELPDGFQGGVLHATHDGDGKFAINGVDDTGEVADPLVDTTGPFTGDLGVGLAAYGHSKTLNITADGAWTIDLKPIGDSPAVNLPLDGNGYAVLRYDGNESNWTFTSQGTDPFTVVQYGQEYPIQLAVSETGAYEGNAQVFAGPSIITIKATGAWTIKES